MGSTRSESETRYSETTASASNIRSGGDVVIAATGDGQGNGGDINIIGSHVAGENVGLLAQRDINIVSAQEVREQKAKNKAVSGEVGVTLGAEAGIGVYVSASMAEGKGKGLGTSYAESTITANNTLTAVSGRDLTIEGGQLYGDRIVANVGRDLTITSQQDRDDYERKDWSGSVDAAVGYGGGSVSVSYNQSGIDSTYKSVNEQSGMQAGSGGFQIYVHGHTQLNGAALASSADPSKNLLSTGSLGVTELKNKAEYDAYSVGFSVSAGTSGGSVSPSLSIPQHDSKSSTTKSGIADGTVIVRGGDSSALAQVERGITELQQEGIKPIFDERKVAEKMEMGRVGLEVGMRGAGDLADTMGWKEGSKEKVILHALVGAGIAALGGGDVVGGLAGAAANQLAFTVMKQTLEAQGIMEGTQEFNNYMQLASLAIGGAVGGGAGAATALAGEKYNRQLHWEDYLSELDKCKENPTDPDCVSILEMSENTKSIYISPPTDGNPYGVVANQNKTTGEVVSYTLTDTDGKPRIIMQADEYRALVVSGVGPWTLGMAPSYGLDLGSAFTHSMQGKYGEALSDLGNVFSSGDCWTDMGIAFLLTAGASAAAANPAKGVVKPPSTGFGLVGGAELTESAVIQANTTVRLADSVKLSNGKVLPKGSVVTVNGDAMKVVLPDGTSSIMSYSKNLSASVVIPEGRLGHIFRSSEAQKDILLTVQLIVNY